MTRRKRTLIDRGAVVVIRGRRGGDLVRDAGLRPIYSGSAQGWVLDAQHLPNLIAYLDHRNVPVDVITTEGDDR